jgi:hypothetical protein
MSDEPEGLEGFKARRSRVGARFKQAISLRVASHALEYFKELSTELEVPYQTLINMALLDYAKHHRRPSLDWQPAEFARPRRKGIRKARSRKGSTAKTSRKKRA